MQRNTPFLKLFGSRHIGATQTARQTNLTALSATLDGVRNGRLHGLAERPTALKLTGNALGNELSIGIGFLDLFDLDLYLLARNLLNLHADFLDIRALYTNKNARSRCMDNHGNSLRMSNNLDVSNVGAFYLRELINSLPDCKILVECLGVIAWLHIPMRAPILIDSNTKSNRIYFLTHVTPPTSCRSRLRHKKCGTFV